MPLGIELERSSYFLKNAFQWHLHNALLMHNQGDQDGGTSPVLISPITSHEDEMASLEHKTDSLNQNLSPEIYWNSELNAGREDGMRTALWEIRDREEFIRILSALDRSKVAFLIELRSARFASEGGVSETSLIAFEELMFGAGGGGLRGPYGQGFVSSFAALGPFVRSLH